MIVNRIRTGLAVAAMAAFGATPLAAQSLADALAGAYRTSGLLDQNEALLRAADEDVAQAVAALRPVFDYVANIRYADPALGDSVTRSAGVEASLLLFDFGRSRLTVDLQKETVLALRAGLTSIEQNVLLRAVSAFLNVRRQQAFVGLRENNLLLITEQLRAAQDRFEVGEVTRTDVSIAEARLAAGRSGLAAAQGALAQARAEYKAVVGTAPRNLAAPPRTPALPASEAAAKSVARTRHPDLIAAQHQVTAGELGIQIAKAGLRPTLRGTASFTLDDDGDDTSSVGIGLRGPIYRGGQLSSVIRKAQAQRDAARGALYTTGQNVEREVSNSWADLAVAIASVQATVQEVRAAELALQGAREELEVGSRTTLDVLDLEQDLLDSQTNQVSALIDRNIAAYAVLASMGLLTVDHLGLGIPTYDPAAYYNAVKNAPTVFVSPQGERLDRVLRSLNRQ